jgi:hypothetical protein
MKRVFSVLLLGLVGGVGAHLGWLHFEQPAPVGGLNAELAFIQQDLHLTREQYAQIKAIHEQSSPHLVALAARVARMREEFNAFESQRKTEGEIDFLEFAHYVEERRRIDRDCLQSTRQLVDASAGVMNADQRKRYFSFLSAAHSPIASLPN